MRTVALCVAAAFAAMTALPTPATAQASRDDIHISRSRCRPGTCRTTLKVGKRELELTTQARDYAAREIPGWDSGSTAGRIASGVAGSILRRQGLKTDQVRVGVGTRLVADGEGTQLRCAVFWIDDEEVGYTRSEEDHVTRATRRTEGADCRVVSATDTNLVRWRYRTGIAPTRDSIAIVYDSLAAIKSPAVSAKPPMFLERLTADGTVEARYLMERDLSPQSFMDRIAATTRVLVKRENGVAVGTIQSGMRARLDLTADASDDEARVMRLLASLMAVLLEGA